LGVIAPFRGVAERPSLVGKSGTGADPRAAAEGESVEALLSAVPVAIDALVRLSRLDVAAVMCALVDLELDGRLVRHAGGRVAIR
jgi:DNA processing protein